MSCNKSKLRARLRREAQAINERNRVPGDRYYKEPMSHAPAATREGWYQGDEAVQMQEAADILRKQPPEQPAPKAHEGWYQLPDENGNFDFYTDSGKRVGRATSMEFLQTIVTDHARAALVPGFVAILNGLGWHSQNGVDSCWCHVKSEPYADHTKQCEQIQALIAAARKAGVE